MMFPNNNKPVVKKLTARSLQSNRTRNRFVILAILLTTWLITSFFSIGLSYTKSLEMQELKMKGTRAEVYLKSPTEQQLAKLHELEYVKDIGLQAKVGNIISTPGTGALQIGLLWYDAHEWTELRRPVIEGLKGKYPEKNNEIAVPLWILQAMGVDDPQIGMSLPLTYSLSNDKENSKVTDTFLLSGWFTEYSHIRSGNSGEMLVSEGFAKAHVADPLHHPGTASIVFKNGNDNDTILERLKQDIAPGADQTLALFSTMVTSSSDETATMIGYGGIILFVMLSGYLLIYNVLYISVSRDTRYYGLLKTLGTTQRQIKKIVRGQAMRLALTAIPLGLLAGAVTAFVVVPMGLKTVNLETGVEISFHPVIFIGTALFAWITTIISCIKPASIAGKVSPVEAVRYTGVAVKAKTKRGTGGSRLHRMALRNIFRVKKRAIIVFLSLFLGLTTFLMVTTLVLSMDTDNFIAGYMENDFVLHNQTMALGFEGEEKPKITEDMIADIREMDGVTSVYKTYRTFAGMKYDPAVFGKYVDEFAVDYNIERPGDAQLLEKESMFYGTNIIGLDSEQAHKLVKKLGLTVDMKRFEQGEIALLDNMGVGGLAIGTKFQVNLLDSDKMATFEIGGVGDFTSLISFHMMAPNVFISHVAVEKLPENLLIDSLGINAKKQNWPQILDQLKALTGGDGELKLESRLDMQELVKSVKLTLYILGGGVGLILAFIGILNYINIMYTGVVARKLEFAVMESIGMTSRQLKKLLLFEGAGYAVISSLLISSIGTLLSYGAYSLFSQEADYAVFTFPYIPLTVAIILVFAVCLTVPLIACRHIKQASIVERLRQME